MVDKELLDILVCPKCKGNIKIHSNEKYIICEKLKSYYTTHPNEEVKSLIYEPIASSEGNPPS